MRTSLIRKVAPRVRISSSTLGRSSESMMCPWISTSSTGPCAGGGLAWTMCKLLLGSGRRRAAAAQHLDEHVLDRRRERRVLQGLDGLLHGVLQTVQIDLVVLQHGAAGARVAVARLADRAGVDHQLVAHLQHV